MKVLGVVLLTSGQHLAEGASSFWLCPLSREVSELGLLLGGQSRVIQVKEGLATLAHYLLVVLHEIEAHSIQRIVGHMTLLGEG